MVERRYKKYKTTRDSRKLTSQFYEEKRQIKSARDKDTIRDNETNTLTLHKWRNRKKIELDSKRQRRKQSKTMRVDGRH